MVTREKYDCTKCGRRIEKTWHKTRKVPVRIFENCGSEKCERTLQQYNLVNSLFGVSQPEPKIDEFVYAAIEGLCPDCLEDEGTHWGLCAGCYFKRERGRDTWLSTWDEDIEEEGDV
ncbi:MAG: hypothetical protein GWN93_24980 [Deltaproteobacteria bacterium]|nr:hypothetical protein [Deltaproteobacteria bacterium]